MVKGIPSVSVTATRELGAEEAATGGGAGFGLGAATGVDAAGRGAGAAATGATGLGVGAFGFRIASITVSGTFALASRITSEAERLKAVLELRIWLRMIAGATFASTI